MSWKYDKYFTEAEMRCRCGCGLQVKDELMEKLYSMREEAGFPFIVTSGARCPSYNMKVNPDTGVNGPHTYGLAVDLAIFGEKAYRLVQLALHHEMTGIGFRQKGDQSGRFIHMDCIPKSDRLHPRPWIWSY